MFKEKEVFPENHSSTHDARFANAGSREREPLRSNPFEDNFQEHSTPVPIITPLGEGHQYQSHENNISTPRHRSSGIGGLMKAYQGRKKFSGGFDEDLNSAFET